MSLVSEKELEGTLTEYQNKIKLNKTNPNWKMTLSKKIQNSQNYEKLLDILWHGNEINIQDYPLDENKKKVIAVLDKSGLYDLQLEFIPSSNLNLEEKKDNYNSERLRNKTIRKRMETFSPYASWLKEIIDLFDNPLFMLDTNFLCRQYYSHYLISIMPQLIEGKSVNYELKIGIPKLTILELERWKNDPKEKKQGKEKEKLAFLAMGEILRLKNVRNIWHIPQLESGLLESFSRIAGSGFADSLIRKEISSKYPDAFIVTSDLMNALAANAENFNVIFFSRFRHIQNAINIVERLASLIYNFSIEFDECKVELHDHEILEIRGMWEGKTPDIWKNNVIEINFLPLNN